MTSRCRRPRHKRGREESARQNLPGLPRTAVPSREQPDRLAAPENGLRPSGRITAIMQMTRPVHRPLQDRGRLYVQRRSTVRVSLNPASMYLSTMTSIRAVPAECTKAARFGCLAR